MARLHASAWDERAAVTEAAVEVGEGVAEVRTAYVFARDVEVITVIVPKARQLILSGVNPHLTPRVVADVVRAFGKGADVRSRERMQSAMSRAVAGLHPLTPPPPEGLPAAAAPWHHDLTRLRTAAGLLDCVLTALASPGRARTTAEAADLAIHAAAVRVDAEALRQVIGRARNRWSGEVSPPAVGDWAGVVGLAKKARSLVDGATGDLLRAPELRKVGAGISLCANALRALDHLGTGNAARAVSLPLVRSKLRSGEGVAYWHRSPRKTSRLESASGRSSP